MNVVADSINQLHQHGPDDDPEQRIDQEEASPERARSSSWQEQEGSDPEFTELTSAVQDAHDKGRTFDFTGWCPSAGATHMGRRSTSIGIRQTSRT